MVFTTTFTCIVSTTAESSSMMMDSPKPIGRLGGAYLSPKQSPVISKQQQQRTIVWTLDKTLRRSMGAFVEIMCKASDDDRTNATTSTNQVRSRTKTKTHLTTAATTTAMRPGPARRYQRPTQLILTTITLQTILLSATIFLLLLSFGLMMMMIGAQAIDDDFFPVIPRSFRFSSDLLTAADSSPSGTGNGFTVSAPSLVNRTTTPGRGGSPFVWQPLPLRATFRPLNRQSQPPQPPREPRPPTPPEPPLALISERSISDPSATGDNLFGSTTANGNRFSSGGGGPSFGDDFFAPTTRANAATGSSESSGPASNFFQPQPPFATLPVTTSSPAPPITIGPTSGSFNSIVDSAPPQPTTTTPRPLIELDDELPTRQPSNRFRPTKAPSDDADTTQLPPQTPPPSPSLANFTDRFNHQANNNDNKRAIPSECFECICEASTNCNPNSRCQTSDVRHTRCGMFLISYDQWLTTGLSRELVTREALARDAAADERAFYDCVTTRSCSERLLAIFMAKNQKDCDRDGRVDCYDYAAIHHSGLEQCASESLLDSQYWNDFNACLGFGR